MPWGAYPGSCGHSCRRPSSTSYAISFCPLARSCEGEPRTTPDGRPYLEYKGQYVRDLSAAEYRRLSAAEVRLFTGHMIAFHGVSAVFFIWLDRRGPVAKEG